jgi:hypothetical protein
VLRALRQQTSTIPIVFALVVDPVGEGFLIGYRGPRGGYRLAREPSDISVEDILRSIGSMEDDSLLNEVVLPA